MDAGLLESADLVVHQGDQRAHDHGHALVGLVADDRRDLVAQALAAAGGHEHQRIAAGDRVLDDRLLQAAERVVAEDLGENAAGAVDRGGRREEGRFGGRHRDGDRSPGEGEGPPAGEGVPARGFHAPAPDR